MCEELNNGVPVPVVEFSLKQRNLKESMIKNKKERLLEESKLVERAKLFAAADSESGLWLQAIPAFTRNTTGFQYVTVAGV